jgi:hypothetical protein
MRIFTSISPSSHTRQWQFMTDDNRKASRQKTRSNACHTFCHRLSGKLSHVRHVGRDVMIPQKCSLQGLLTYNNNNNDDWRTARGQGKLYTDNYDVPEVEVMK